MTQPQTDVPTSLTDSCVLWVKAKNNRGYGVQWHEGKLHLAHRVAFKTDRGRWPLDGLVVDHLCAVKACVNPEHLDEVPNHVNLRRAVVRGDAAVEARRLYWRAANARRRTYSPLYTLGGE